ncbi:acyltransferase [Paludibacter sp.]
MYTSFYTPEELANIGFKDLGTNVKISRNTSIYYPEKISIGSNVRIDDFCILSGNIHIGSYIHISAYTAIYGRFGVILEDFVTVSGRVLIYSQSDDYSGEFMTNPMVPLEYTNVSGGTVHMKKHSIIGAGSVVLPNVTIEEGGCLGTMSLLKSNLPAWEIYGGIPAKKIKNRSKKLLEITNLWMNRCKMD